MTAPAVASPFAAPAAADPGTAFQAGQPAAASYVVASSPAVAASSAAVNAAAASTPPAPGGVNAGGGQGAASPQASAVLQAYGRTPLAFEPNYGQTSSQVLFLSQGPGFDAFLTDAGAVLSLPVPAQAGAATGRDVLTLSFAGADPAPQVYATGQLPGVSKYFAGNDPSQWIADVPNYAGVVYHDVYPGIDLHFSGDSQNELEYSFTVAPGADPSQIRTSWQGAQSVTTDAQGDLLLTTASGQTLTETAPALYQTVNGVQRPVASQAVVNADGTTGFRAAGYDPTLPLVIDPRIVYSSYLGGSGADYAYAVAADASGAAYVAGVTASTDFPTASGYQNSNAGGTDAFVTKLNAQGNGLVYSTYLGGASNDEDYGVAVDLSGRAWVVGTTSPGIGGGIAFPTTPDAVERTVPTGGTAFAARLSAGGDQLTYSTLLGDGSTATAVAVDALGDAYLTGSAAYNALFGDFFPTTSGAFQTSPGGGTDAFLAKLAPTLPGSAYSVTLAYSSYLGGSSTDQGQGVAVDGSGDAYVTGYTQSSNFPTTSGAFETSKPSGTQASFVVKVNPSGSALDYATYLAGGSADAGDAIAVDRQGDAFVTGATYSSSFPTTSGAFQTSHGGFGSGNAFVAKLKPDGSGLTYGSYLGGGGETGTGIAVDSSGQATVAGWTTGSSFPVTSNAIQSTSGGGTDAWAAQVNAAGTTLNYATYLGGSGTDEATGVAVDAQGDAYLAGFTDSTNFPTGPGAYQTGLKGGSGYDAFISKIAQGPGPPVFTAVSPDTGSSSTDQVTDTGNLTITGTAAAGATVTLSQEGVGVIDTVTASASGLWTSTYFASAHTLPEGTAAFTAAETVAGQTSDPTADWLVTVDETNPVVTLTAPATTTGENPLCAWW